MSRPLELLSPAKNAETAIEAIKHGADAVYIGGPLRGARKAASNSLDDIKRVTEFAHLYNAKVYVTVNTIIYDNEIKSVEKMIASLYDNGVDAIIVQDMGILRMDIPPIALHASTQCDIRTPEKAKFLEEAGFSQIVLARELSIKEIRDICNTVSVPVEVFVHGALCMSFSGRCGAGYASASRSGNRGECPQICRQAFTLRDASGKILSQDKYLLSLKDFRAENYLPELIEAGVSSFKIEGRLKDTGYVKNVTASYNNSLNRIIENSAGDLKRASYGITELKFNPILEKSFNRGFTSYMLSGNRDKHGLASLKTPKSLGETITNTAELRPGDGISFFDRGGQYKGVLVNAVKEGNIIGNKPFKLPAGTQLRRTSSVEWDKLMASDTAKRVLPMSVTFGADSVTATSRGVSVSLPIDLEGSEALRPTDHRQIFEKTGNTPFKLVDFQDNAKNIFYPASSLTALRRRVYEQLEAAMEKSYHREERLPENKNYPFPYKKLDFRDNVANYLAEEFYRDHGVTEIEPALEKFDRSQGRGKILMSSRYCVLKELGLCLKNRPKIKMPLRLSSGNMEFIPEFDCKKCEMNLRLNETS